MKTLLFINACVNRERSRTNRLSNELIKLLKEKEDFDTVTEIILEKENIQALTSESLGKRFALAKKGEFDDEIFKYAHQLAQADYIVIAAPYWDFSFPAILKNYIEAVSVVGITYYYAENGRPAGLSKGQKLYYVTTAGGFIREFNFGYSEVQSLAAQFGIKESKSITAEGLDIKTNDAESILKEAISTLPDKL